MRGLLSYHFLRWFAGDLKNRRKQSVSIFNDQIPETNGDMTIGPNCPTSEESRADRLSDGKDLQVKEVFNKKNKTKIRNG